MCLAIPGKVVELCGGNAPFIEGIVEFAGVRRKVSLACVPDIREGNYVLVHAGVGIAVVDENEAEKMMEALQDADVADELSEMAQIPD
jgi:hydrogenase expression/formation protein HypC